MENLLPKESGRHLWVLHGQDVYWAPLYLKVLSEDAHLIFFDVQDRYTSLTLYGTLFNVKTASADDVMTMLKTKDENTWCVFPYTSVIKRDGVAVFIEKIKAETGVSIFLLDDVGSVDIPGFHVLRPDISHAGAMATLRPEVPLYAHLIYTEIFSPEVRYISMLADRSAEAYKGLPHKQYGEPSYSWGMLTKDLLLQYVFGKDFCGKALWGEKLNCHGSTYVVSEDFKVYSKQGTARAGSSCPGIDNFRVLKDTPEVRDMVYNFLFKPIPTEDTATKSLRYECRVLGGLTLSQWVVLLCTKYEYVKELRAKKFQPPVRFNLQCSLNLLQTEVLMRRVNVLKTGTYVDGFELECVIPSRLYGLSAVPYVKHYAGVFKQLFIEAACTHKYIVDNPDLKQLLWVSCIDVTPAGFCSATVAIKGGSIPYKE